MPNNPLDSVRIGNEETHSFGKNNWFKYHDGTGAKFYHTLTCIALNVAGGM
jgi:hypothetical protein